MNFWTRSFRNRIRPEPLSCLVVVLVWTLTAGSALGQKRDYFTELEIADMREAQEIGWRTEVLLEIAGRRLAGLGLIEPADDPSGKPGFGGTLGRVFITILNPQAAKEIEAVESERAALEHDLSGHSREDLLRGYYQALEEAMDNIDDAWERNRGDITDALSDLEEFSEAAHELLEDMETQSDDEAQALDDAIEQTDLALEGARKALENLPRPNEP